MFGGRALVLLVELTRASDGTNSVCWFRGVEDDRCEAGSGGGEVASAPLCDSGRDHLDRRREVMIAMMFSRRNTDVALIQ